MAPTRSADSRRVVALRLRDKAYVGYAFFREIVATDATFAIHRIESRAAGGDHDRSESCLIEAKCVIETGLQHR